MIATVCSAAKKTLQQLRLLSKLSISDLSKGGGPQGFRPLFFARLHADLAILK